jgi:hypothetical protein
MQSQRHPAQKHEGQVLILVAIASLILFGFAALAVDAGLALSERRGAQNAADAASLAAARAMVDGVTNQAELRATAQHYAQLNGYDIADLANDVRFPDAETVEVDINWEVPRIFLGAFYDGDWSVSTNAVASLDTVPADYGLIALDESGNAINATGNTHVRVNDGGVMSNADISCAGSSTITADTAVHAAGTVLDTSVASIACHIGGDEDTSSGRAPIEDPLAGTPEPPGPPSPPSGSGHHCSQLPAWDNDWTRICGPGRYTTWPSPSTHQLHIRLQPGHYYFDGVNVPFTNSSYEIHMVDGGHYTFHMRNAQLTIGAGPATWDMSNTGSVNMYFVNSTFRTQGNSTITLGSGLYYFDNSHLRKTAGSRMTGTGVSFFFKNGGSMIGDGYNDNFHITAPATPLYPGMPPYMLIHAPPSNTNFPLTLEASSTNALLKGIVYMPSGDFRLAGNTGGTWAEGQLITGSFAVAGSSNGSIQYEQLIEMETPQVWLTR